MGLNSLAGSNPVGRTMADKIKAVAQLTVTSEGRTEVVKGFDTAWYLAKELALPVTIKFDKFVRVE